MLELAHDLKRHRPRKPRLLWPIFYTSRLGWVSLM